MARRAYLLGPALFGLEAPASCSGRAVASASSASSSSRDAGSRRRAALRGRRCRHVRVVGVRRLLRLRALCPRRRETLRAVARKAVGSAKDAEHRRDDGGRGRVGCVDSAGRGRIRSTRACRPARSTVEAGVNRTNSTSNSPRPGLSRRGMRRFGTTDGRGLHVRTLSRGESWAGELN